MASIKIAGNKFVIEAGFTMKDLKTVKQYRPELLKLYDEDKKPVFLVTEGAVASASHNGIVFDAATVKDGLACATLDLPKAEGDVTEAIAELVGPAITKLKEVEANVDKALEAIKAERDSVKECIVEA